MSRSNDKPDRLVLDYPAEARNGEPSEVVPTVLAITIIAGGMILVTLGVLRMVLGFDM